MTDLLQCIQAMVVSNAAPESAEWYAARRSGLTATDIPRILGLSPYGNSLSVYFDKKGELAPDLGGPAARWGHLLEDVIARAWAEDHGTEVARVGVMANRERPWMRAALDRVCDPCPTGDGPCGLEVKTRSAYKAGAWREDIPDDVLAQVAWQSIVTGFEHIHVAVLIGGNDLREFTYERDAELEAYLMKEATAFWQLVQDGTPPEVDATTMVLDLLDRLFPSRAGVTYVDSDLIAGLRYEYDQAHAAEKAATGGKEWAKYRTVALLAGGETLATGDPDNPTPVATYKPQMRQHVDLDRLKAEHPEAYKACVTKKPTSPVLRWINAKDS